MALTNWLIDKSALYRINDADNEWLPRIQRGLVRISTVTLLEVGFSTRNGTDHRSTLGEPPVSSMPIEHLTPAIEARAVEIQMLLADRGHIEMHRPACHSRSAGKRVVDPHRAARGRRILHGPPLCALAEFGVLEQVGADVR